MANMDYTIVININWTRIEDILCICLGLILGNIISKYLLKRMKKR